MRHQFYFMIWVWDSEDHVLRPSWVTKDGQELRYFYAESDAWQAIMIYGALLGDYTVLRMYGMPPEGIV